MPVATTAFSVKARRVAACVKHSFVPTPSPNQIAAVTELLELGRERARLRRTPQAQRSEPYTDPSELHQLVSSTKHTPSFVPVAVTAPSQKVGKSRLRKSWSGTIACSRSVRCSPGTVSVQSSGQLRPTAR